MTERKLTKAQRAVVSRIKTLHNKGAPLNITAVRRHSHELLRAAYGTTRFWGWRAALADAGIDYARIRCELQDFAVCRICGPCPLYYLAVIEALAASS